MANIHLEYFLEVSAKENAADESVKEFFDGYERAYVPMEVAKKVIKQLSEVAVESVPQVIEKKVKFCVSCLTECDENATKCHFCKETTFADDIMKAAEIKRKVDKLKEKQEKEAEIERANLEAQIREREEKERIKREKERLEREARETNESYSVYRRNAEKGEEDYSDLPHDAPHHEGPNTPEGMREWASWYAFNKMDDGTYEAELDEAWWWGGGHNDGGTIRTPIPEEWFELTYDEFLERVVTLSAAAHYGFTPEILKKRKGLKKFFGFEK